MDIKIKVIPEDFIVNECNSMLVAPSFENMDYVILLLHKKAYTTFEAISAIAKKWNINSNLLGYAGLKDEDGVTSQRITIPKEYDNDELINEFNEMYSSNNRYIFLSKVGYADKKVEIGKLQGNSFVIKLRNVTKDMATVIKSKSCKRVTFPNYYDTQRFGIPNMPKRTHLVGQALCDYDYDLALKYLKEGTPNDFKDLGEGIDGKELFGKMDKNKLLFYYNAYMSTKFNQCLIDSIRNKIDFVEKYYDGMLYVLPQRGSDLNKLEVDRFCIPRSNIDVNFERSLEFFYRYTYVNTFFHVGSIENDNIFDGMYAVDIDFFLPSGCYATMAIKQFLCDMECEMK